MRLSFIRPLVLATLALVAAPALAEEVTIRVAYDADELASDAGYAAVTARVADAAEEACAPAFDRSLSRDAVRECKSTLVRKAIDQLESRRALQP